MEGVVSCHMGAPLDILIIDDRNYTRAFVHIHLQEAGYETGEVEPTSLYDVLEAIHTHRPALIITDYEMPTRNGESILRAIREDPALQSTLVIMLTTHREEELVERLSRWDPAGHLIKPIRPEELVEKVERIFAQKTPPGAKPGIAD